MIHNFFPGITVVPNNSLSSTDSSELISFPLPNKSGCLYCFVIAIFSGSFLTNTPYLEVKEITFCELQNSLHKLSADGNIELEMQKGDVHTR